ncbi:MAG: hypothetical protein H6719_01985 [Sandaracinaceae bacterium]|nr:hypothetical protein [Sandaracinaceae bacterium]
MNTTQLFKALRLIASGSTLVAIIACGGSDDSSGSGSSAASTGAAAEAEGPRETRTCDASSTSLGQCIVYDLAEASSEDALREQCTSMEGTLGTDPCPTEARLGTCNPNLGRTVRHYYDGNGQYQLSTASAECTMLRNGTWAAATP